LISLTRASTLAAPWLLVATLAGAETATSPSYPAWPSGCAAYANYELIACLQANAFDFGGLARHAEANAMLAPPVGSEARVVFFGDSITEGWSRPEMGGFFPGRPYVNRGVGGQTTAQMLVRFRPDVIALQPKAVVILAGTNDIAGNSGPMSLAASEGNLASFSELAQAHGIKVVLASLLPVTDAKRDRAGEARRQTRERPPEKVLEINRWLADYARANGHVYLDYFAAVVGANGELRPELTEDGLHPNRAGYDVMAPLAAKAIAEALGAKP
jgi:lysophospholipase L1-like esterase